MSDRRGSRFALEVLFLSALAVGLALARLQALEIVGVMLLGWVIVAAIEWAAWRDEPHYGAGLPPRYYVPQVNLPPAQPLEQVAVGYPEARGYQAQRDEAPTWIATAALRDEMLGGWPVAQPQAAEPEETEPGATDEPGEPEAEVVPVEPAAAGAAAVEPAALEPKPVHPREPEPVDRWDVASLPVEPISTPVVAAEPEPEPEPEPVPLPDPVAEEPQPEAAPERQAEPAAAPAVLRESAGGLARYHLDPLAEPPPRRRFGRGGGEELQAIEVPSRPDGQRALPGLAS
jgi:hypothetical protein